MDARQTSALLPYPALAQEIAEVLADTSVQVPARLVQALPGGGSLFVMPALDRRITITKLITFTPSNAGSARATIQGDVIVFDIATGERKMILDGPTVTARRTAAVSLLAAQRLAPDPRGPMLIVGAGVQGRSHLEAFAAGLGVTEFLIASRGAQNADALVAHAQGMGLKAGVVHDAEAAMAQCRLVVTCTPARQVVLHTLPRADAFVCAVGAFTPAMVELSPDVCRYFANHGTIVVDTLDARHEAGDLLQAGLNPDGYPSLAELCAQSRPTVQGPVLFKSCGWAGWDLAAARLTLRQSTAGGPPGLQ